MTDLNVRDLASVIEEAIRRLPDGELRLTIADSPLRDVCPGSYWLDGKDGFLRKSIPSGNDDIEEQYYEEITTIEKIMVENGVPIELADGQSDLNDELFEKENRQYYAIQLWDWYAVPWRLRGDTVHMIYSSCYNYLSPPDIHSYDAEYFIRSLAKHHHQQAKELNKQVDELKKRLSFWKNFGIIVFILTGIVLWVIIEGLISKWMA